MVGQLTKAAFVASLALSSLAGDSNEWKERAVYQVLTDRFAREDGSTQACTDLKSYCGGNWKGLENNLDYIKGMGFDAIWITPVVDNIDGGYHGYWAANWEKVNSNFGSEDDLKSLVQTAHSKDIWVMVDVVANHVGPVGSDFSRIYPFNQSEHYHDDCQITNWNDPDNVEHCRLADLPDLNQDNSYVRQYLKDWVQNLVQTYEFDGIRIDTIPEVKGQFWSEYGESSGVFQMGECFNGDPNYVGPYQNDLTGLFNYPMYFTIKDVFGGKQSMNNIESRYNGEGAFKDLSLLGVFVDNHDNARFLSQYDDRTSFKSALTFALTSQGIPFFYYGSEQYYSGSNDPLNRESLWQAMNTDSDVYQQVAKINSARKASQIWNQDHVQRYSDDTFYAFSRGEFLVAVTNSHNDQQRTVTYQPFSSGTTICNIFYPTTDCQTVTDSVNVYLSGGESKIYVPQSKLAEMDLDDEQILKFLQE